MTGLYNNTENQVNVFWPDDFKQPYQACIFRPITKESSNPTRWHTSEGITLGISLRELEKILGPLTFSGFGWDYGGTVDARISQGLIIRLAPEKNEGIDEKYFGEGVEVNSQDPFLEQLKIHVSEICVEFGKLMTDSAIRENPTIPATASGCGSGFCRRGRGRWPITNCWR